MPDVPYTAAFGESRSVGVVLGRVIPGRPLLGAPHPGRWPGLGPGTAGEVVIVAGVGSAAIEVARHDQVAPGQASIKDEHYPERSNHPLDRAPRATKESEATFLALGEGATRYLVEAAAVGTRRLEKKMAEAVTLAALHGADVVDRALGIAAIAGRFAEGDLESIIVHASGETRGAAVPPAEHSLASRHRRVVGVWVPSRRCRHDRPGPPSPPTTASRSLSCCAWSSTSASAIRRLWATCSGTTWAPTWAMAPRACAWTPPGSPTSWPCAMGFADASMEGPR